MPQSKDVSEKILEDYNDVFADIVNNLVFDGREVLRPEELEPALAVSQFKMDDGLHEQERDTAKHWKRGTIIMAAWGLENQTASDPEMPLRVAGYDGAVYKDQVNRRHSARRQKQEPQPFYPSITIVLYFGTTRWTGPRDLKSCFPEMPQELEPLVPDYPIHVIEVAFLSPEQVGKLKSDFRYVADYLVQTRTSGEYVAPDGQIDHVDETLKLLGAITGDDRFQEVMNHAALTGAMTGKERVTMCSVIDSYIAKGREQGLEEGRAEMRSVLDSYLAKGREQGREEGRRETQQKYESTLAGKDRTIQRMEQELRELRARCEQV